MSRIAWCGFLAVASLAPAAAQEQESRQDQGLLQGTWQAVEINQGGKLLPEIPEGYWVVTVAKDRLTLELAPQETPRETTFTLNATAKPKHIDLMVVGEFEKGLKMAGIYQVTGDTLVLCLSDQVGAKRPTDFTAPVGSKYVLVTFKKVKK